jgi:glutamine cyclotransferase
MNRRRFLAAAASAAVLSGKDIPRRKAKVVRLWKSPDGYPNALEATPEGVWVGEQVSDRAFLLDWKTGKVLHKIETESGNTSGIAYGDGAVWMGQNGSPTFRDRRPWDQNEGSVIKCDAKTGKTLGRWPIPGGGGVHGLEFAEGKLWVTSLKIQKLSQVDPKTFDLVHQIPVHLGRAHGLAWDPLPSGRKTIWCMHSWERVIHRLDAADGELLEVIELAQTDPDPHGLCIHQGKLYYCDAGIAPGPKSNDSPAAGYICRIDLA